MANQLANSSSLYLRQHADNPVNWWPWGKEAIEEAQRQDKPILVSVGYSSCHWCHVMAHECFEDPYIAGIMNQHFICIKVDREERPDVDQIYMDAVTMITQRGGWPLHAFCLPDGRPFFGGTYFPPDDRGNGMIPWPQLLMRISEAYRKDRAGLLENAESVIKNIAHLSGAPGGEADWSPQELLVASQQLIGYHDDKLGGFGQAPKFPPCHSLNFLQNLRGSATIENRPDLASHIDRVSLKTLRAMANGGLYDHIGGGFYRYVVDATWTIPHFEKMLYDNAQLLQVFARACLRYDDDRFRAVLRGTLGWLEQEMRVPGGYAASIDADSPGGEGSYYVWTMDDLQDILGDRAGAFAKAYGVTEDGNFEAGTTHLCWQDEKADDWTPFAEDRTRLLGIRCRREAPGRDPKILLSWNSLLLKGMIEAGFALEDDRLLARCIVFANELWKGFADSDGNLKRLRYPDQPAEGEGFLDDYAFFAEALLALAARIDLIEPGASATCIAKAKLLADKARDQFGEESSPGFYYTPETFESPLPRKKEWYDNATPTGNSALLHVFLQLGTVLAEPEYLKAFESLRKAYSGLAERIPNGIGHALSALTAEAIGLPVLRAKAPGCPEGLWKAIRERGGRQLFVLIEKNDNPEADWELCVGPQCFEKSKDPFALLEKT